MNSFFDAASVSDFFTEVFNKYGFIVEKSVRDCFSTYASLLVEYNKRFNLTAITEPRDIILKHFLDSVLVLRYVSIAQNASIIDIGTGAGFPLIPIKLIRPDLNITLVDSNHKKTDFLKLVCTTLSINANIISERSENIGKSHEYREEFDYSIARAVAGYSVLSELCIPLVKPNGFFVAMKSSEEASACKSLFEKLGAKLEDEKVIFVEELGERRYTVVKKIANTSTIYPRNSNQIIKKPLV